MNSKQETVNNVALDKIAATIKEIDNITSWLSEHIEMYNDREFEHVLQQRLQLLQTAMVQINGLSKTLAQEERVKIKQLLQPLVDRLIKNDQQFMEALEKQKEEIQGTITALLKHQQAGLKYQGGYNGY